MDRLLLIEPDEELSKAIASALAGRFVVDPAADAADAERLAGERHYDAAVSEYQLAVPGDGIRTLSGLASRHGVPGMLLTAHNVDQILHAARQEGIGILLAKTHPVNLQELGVALDILCGRERWGIGPHLLQGAEEVCRLRIEREQDVAPACLSIVARMRHRLRDPDKWRLVLDELVSNAFYHGILEEGHAGRSVDIVAGWDGEKAAVGVSDRSGALDVARVLGVLDRHVRAEGGFDQRGRGLHLARIYADRVYVTVSPRSRTEVVAIMWDRAGAYQGYKPVWVQAVQPVAEEAR